MGKFILKVDGVKVSEDRSIELVAGSNITLTAVDTEGDHQSAQVTIASTGGGASDHGALTGLTDDDHTQYRLESEDHTHATTGLQGGQLDHGTALTGLTDDDHTQYLKETDVAAKGDIYVASADNTVGVLSVGTDNQIIVADSAQALGVRWTDNTGGSGAPTDADYLVGTANGSLSAEIVVGTTPGGELGGTWASPTVDATHSGSAHHTQSHDHSAAGDGQTLTPATLNIPNAAAPAPTTEGQVAWDNDGNFLVVGDGAATQTFYPVVDATSDPVAGATTSADGTEATVARKDHRHAYGNIAGVDFLVGTATGELSAEIAVGTSPGGELGGTWASPTVDATHSGSAHHTQSHNHSAAGDGTTLTPATLNIPNAAAPAPTAEGEVAWDNDGNFLVVGDGAATKNFYPVVDATSDPAAVSTAAADGTETTTARKDHVHAHEAAHINHDTTWAAKGDLIVASANDTASVVTVGANDTILMADSAQGNGVKWQAPATTSEIADIADTESAGTSDTWARGDHVHSGAAYVKESVPQHLVTFSKEGNLSTGTGTIRWYNDTGQSITLDSARGSVGTAPASQSILIDINNNGTSVWASTQANRITIAAASNTDEGGAFDDSTIADGEYITVDIDQVGSGTVGADLSVSIWGHWSS